MQNRLNEAEVKDILRHREQKIISIHKKMHNLYKELENTDEVLDAIALPSAEIHGMPGGKGEHKDLGDVILQYNRQLYQRNEEIRKIMWELVEEEDTISRVWACFHALSEPYYTILQELYVENQLYQAVEDSFDISHKTFEKYRQHGIELIIRFFECGDSIAELMHRHKTKDDPVRKKKQKTAQSEEASNYIQISLEDFVTAAKNK